jgi:hypothetical protein
MPAGNQYEEGSKQAIPPNRRLPFTGLHGIIFQKKKLFFNFTNFFLLKLFRGMRVWLCLSGMA